MNSCEGVSQPYFCRGRLWGHALVRAPSPCTVQPSQLCEGGGIVQGGEVTCLGLPAGKKKYQTQTYV